MSYDYEIDKERAYFTQCNDTILFKCPECTSTKISRHCKIFRNFPSLWRHLKQDHNDILESRMIEIIQVLNDVFKAFKWNMFPKWEYSEFNPVTTTSSFLMDGRPVRADVYENLKNISKLLKTQSEHYPKFKPKLLMILIEKAIGPKDPRIYKKYLERVVKFSEKDKIRGLYDVTQFCDILGA